MFMAHLKKEKIDKSILGISIYILVESFNVYTSRTFQIIHNKII